MNKRPVVGGMIAFPFESKTRKSAVASTFIRAVILLQLFPKADSLVA